MSVSTRIGLSCGLGSIIGLFVALSVNGWLWWIGMPIGGASAMIVFSFRQIVTAIPHAYRKATGAEIDWVHVKISARELLYLNILGTIMWPFIPILSVVSGRGIDMFSILLAPITCLILFVALIASVHFGRKKQKSETQTLVGEVNTIKSIAIKYNIFSFYFFHMWVFIARYIARVYSKVPAAIARVISALKTTRAFFWNVFIRVHSDEGMLCFISGTLGVAVGYLVSTSSPLAGELSQLAYLVIGGIAGALIGVLDYELVSKRLLKLAPKKS